MKFRLGDYGFERITFCEEDRIFGVNTCCFTSRDDAFIGAFPNVVIRENLFQRNLFCLSTHK